MGVKKRTKEVRGGEEYLRQLKYYVRNLFSAYSRSTRARDKMRTVTVRSLRAELFSPLNITPNTR